MRNVGVDNPKDSGMEGRGKAHLMLGEKIMPGLKA